MKQSKKLLPLLCLAAAAAVLAAALALLSGLEEGEGAALPLFGVDAADLAAVAYRDDTGAQTVEAALTRSAGGWALADDPTLPLDQEEAAQAAEGIAGLTALRDLGAQADTADMGFEIPSMVLRVAQSGADLAATGESAAGVYTLTIGAKNTVTGAYYGLAGWNGHVYTIDSAVLLNLCRTPRQLYAPQQVTDLEQDELTAMTLQLPDETLEFRYDGETWTLADDPAYPLEQAAVTRMAATVCALETKFAITSPAADSAYGLDAPQAVVTVTAADGSSLTVAFGAVNAADETACYLRASNAPGVVYEVYAGHLPTYAYSKQTLRAATAETAAES